MFTNRFVKFHTCTHIQLHRMNIENLPHLGVVRSAYWSGQCLGLAGRSWKRLSGESGKSLGLDLVGERSGQRVVVRGRPVDRRSPHFAGKKLKFVIALNFQHNVCHGIARQ